ncbi:hypothetical protein [Streptomyces sp. 8L]|uniref:hypothetical protein n=1 Tax=Streptomyces sp. 8L TaxID=2877242 RepID=UPI001CD382C0|nr:hypothetical protein [Streptomyces sp. 8L]MCA1223625.1 hypothetical protein [Streptomyces sp. 8L]
MKLYLTTVRRWWVVPVAIVVLVLACQGVGERSVPLPDLGGHFSGIATRYFTPLIVVLPMLYCLERQIVAAEVTAAVAVSRWDGLVIVATAALGHVVGLMVGIDVARNLMLLLAAALIVRRFGNEAAAGGVCLLIMLVTASLGRAYGAVGHAVPRWWAIPLYPAASPGAWGVTVILFAFGLRLYMQPRYRRNMQ